MCIISTQITDTFRDLKNKNKKIGTPGLRKLARHFTNFL